MIFLNNPKTESRQGNEKEAAIKGNASILTNGGKGCKNHRATRYPFQ
jgi:hypothetical protein